MDDVQKPPAIEVTLEKGRQGHGEDGLFPMGDENIDVTTEGQTGGDVGTPDDAEVLDWIKDRLISYIGSPKTPTDDRTLAARLLRRIAEDELEGEWSQNDRNFLWFVAHDAQGEVVRTETLRIIARTSMVLAELPTKKLTPT